jgi:phosphate transport system protein
MVEKFHDELDQVKKEVIKMGHLARDMLQKSVKALKERDQELANWVLLNKTKIAEYDDKIEEKTFRLIALYQPMAKDMRKIACILKLITYLTRIGRYGKDIAKIVEQFQSKGHVKKLIHIPHMADIVCSMIDDALEAFEKEDVTKFNNFIDRECIVDEMRYSIYRECITYMLEDQKVITRCMNYTMVARYLERCGDHACKMAEKITYMITGERVEIDCRENTSKACFTGMETNE